ncbi:MAG: hemolysin family protein [Bacteroidetes bacterium]|nr:hemolysin family protein [Bacteroidota bacterium]
MSLLILYLLLAIAVSFLCSIMEAVILSVSMSYIQTREMEGHKSAAILKRLKSNIDKPLSAILTINTIAHTIGAAGVGAQAVKIFGEAYFGLISAILTLLILFFSEIVPKTIGAKHWRILALPSAGILLSMIYISYPLVVIAQWFTKLISGRQKQKTVSRDELSAMAYIGMQEGIFDKSEQVVINNMLRLRGIKVRKIMTPRTVIVTEPEEISIAEFFKNKKNHSFSRIPVFADNMDSITGYVLKNDVFEKMANDEFDVRLKNIKRPILVAYEHLNVYQLFEQLLEKKEHIALIVDEYGGVEGIATLEDIFETMIGLEITDETDYQTDLQRLARERWKARASKLKIKYDADEPDAAQDGP